MQLSEENRGEKKKNKQLVVVKYEFFPLLY